MTRSLASRCWSRWRARSPTVRSWSCSSYLGQEVMESAKDWTPERGTPQGAVVSPLLSNISLDPLDHQMAQSATRWCGTPTTV